MHPLPEELLMLKQGSIKWECPGVPLHMGCLVGSQVGTETQLCPARYTQWDTPGKLAADTHGDKADRVGHNLTILISPE